MAATRGGGGSLLPPPPPPPALSVGEHILSATSVARSSLSKHSLTLIFYFYFSLSPTTDQ